MRNSITILILFPFCLLLSCYVEGMPNPNHVEGKPNPNVEGMPNPNVEGMPNPNVEGMPNPNVEGMPNPNSDSDDMSWDAYKKAFEKHYINKESEEAHKAAFMETKKRILEHNGRHRRGEKKYSLAYNHMSDMLPEEKAGLRGLIPMSKTKGKQYYYGCSTYKPLTNVKIPDQKDWRTEGYVTEVKNQYTCGSCYAFSTTGVIEGQIKRKTGKLISLSEQQILDCSPASSVNQICYGGNPIDTYNIIKNSGGIVSEATYPYKARQMNYKGTCTFNKAKVVATVTGVCYQVAQGNEVALKNAVATQGPISIQIHTNNTSFKDLSGVHTEIYDDDDCRYNDESLTDHAVLIVGYGTNKTTGQDYWIIKNSWGNWADKGYIKMVRGKNCLGIANFPTYPVV